MKPLPRVQPSRVAGRRLARLLGLVAVFAFAFPAGSALAEPKGAFMIGTVDSGTSGGTFNGARDIAVNDATGDAYVVDDENHRIQRFSATGEFELAWGGDVVQGGAADAFEVCAVAADCQAGTPGGGNGLMDNPQGIAIDQDTGLVYVTDRDNRRINVYDADGVFQRALGWDVVVSGPGNDSTLPFDEFEVCVPADGDLCKAGVAGGGGGQFGEVPLGTLNEGSGSLRLDVSPPDAGPAGSLYVADPGNRRVMEFGLDGAFMRAWGWDVVASGPGDDTTDPANEFEICVPADGDVCQPGPPSTATNPAELPNGRFVSGAPLHVAIGPNGVLYAPNENYSTTAGVFFRFDVTQLSPAGLLLQPLDKSQSGFVQNLSGLEVDRADSHVFAVEGDGNPLFGIHEIDPATQEIVESHLEDLTLPAIGGFGRSSASGTEYLSFGNRVLVLTEAGAVPADASLEPVNDDELDGHTAVLRGSITPNGPETGLPASYHFEVRPAGSGADWDRVGPDEIAGVGSSPVAVSQTAESLEANRLYEFRLVVDKGFGNASVTTAPLTFTTDTLPPAVETGAAQHRTATSAQVRGRINPNNLPTSYYVEYGPTTAYGQTTAVASAGSSGSERLVVSTLSGLSPGTTYHYRFVATNGVEASPGDDLVEGSDHEFRTLETDGGVDDARQRDYELVTPPDKNNRRGGPPVRGDVPHVGLPSPDGNSMLFGIDFGILEGDSAAFAHVWDILTLRRGSQSWNVDPLVNVKSHVNAGASLTNVAGASADMTVVASHHKAYLFESGSALGTRVFGDTGGSIPGSGWYDWLETEEAVNSIPQSNADQALIDDEGERMVRWGPYRGLLGPGGPDSVANLGPKGTSSTVYFQAPPGSGEKELVNECTGVGAAVTQIPRRVDAGAPGADPSDTIGTQPCPDGSVTSRRGALPGGKGTARTAMSEDGARIFFTSPDPAPSSTPTACGPSGGPGTDCPPQLYVRQYDSTGAPTVRWISQDQIPGSQSIVKMGAGVDFEAASNDGGTVYFKTNAPLTPDDPDAGLGPTETPNDQSWDLYRYELPGDRDAPPTGGTLTRISGGPLQTADPNAPVGGVVRFASDDGKRVYFVTRGIIGDPEDSWNQPTGNGTTGPDGDPSSTDTANLYLYDDTKTGEARWKFIARLPTSTTVSRISACATTNSGSGMSQGLQALPARTGNSCFRGSPSGRVAVFETDARLTLDDDDGAGDIYLYDAAADELTRVSAPRDESSGYPCALDGVCNAVLGHTNTILGFGDRFGLRGQQHANLAETDGVVSLFFESPLRLIEADTNARFDVYRWRAGELTLVSPGSGDHDAYFSGNSSDGEDVFFATTERLDPREIDEDWDIYNARPRGRAFPPPPVAPAPCAPLSGGCIGEVTPPVDGTRAPSAVGGNAKSPPRRTLTVKRPSRKALRQAARTGVVKIPVRVSGSGRVTAVARAKVGRSLRQVGSGSVRAKRAGLVTVKLRLRAAVAKRLRTGKPVRLSITARMRGARPRTSSIVIKGGRR
jgi:NHL repeat